jgi:MFS family permease
MLEGRPKAVLAFLCIINLVNFMDRGVIPGAPIQFGSFVSCTLETPASKQSVYVGMSVSAFVVCYAIASPVFGQLVQSQPAFRLLGIGLTIWVTALFVSGLAYFAGNTPFAYYLFLFGRAVSGAGEAAFQCIVPPYVEEFAPARSRAFCLALFYTAIPVGTAIGYEYGALMAEHVGWGWAFLLEAALMTPFAAASFLLPPASTISEQSPGPLLSPSPAYTDQSPATSPYFEATPNGLQTPAARTSGSTRMTSSYGGRLSDRPPPQSVFAQLVPLLTSPAYVCLVLGYAAQTATVIGISTYGPVFLLGFGSFTSQSACAFAFAVSVSIGGVLGTPLGGVLTDAVLQRSRASSPRVSAEHESAREAALIAGVISVQMLLGLTAMTGAAAIAATPSLVYIFLLLLSLAVFFIYGTSAGLTRVIMLTVPTQTRPFAIALQTLGLHLFGDVPSPVVVGAIKDSLAPHCGITFGNSSAHSHPGDACGIVDMGHLNPECVASAHDRRGLHLTIILAVLWSTWAVVLWATTFLLLKRRERQLAKRQQAEDLPASSTPHLAS